jgi:hypothetical protein
MTKTLANIVDLINPQNQDPILITTNSSNTPTYAEKTINKTNHHQKEEINNSNITKTSL